MINDYPFDLLRLIAALCSLISCALQPVKENDYYKEEVSPVLHQIGEKKMTTYSNLASFTAKNRLVKLGPTWRIRPFFMR